MIAVYLQFSDIVAYMLLNFSYIEYAALVILVSYTDVLYYQLTKFIDLGSKYFTLL